MTDATHAGVVIRGLRKHYGDTRALDGLDLEARPGEVLGVAGPNGAGKSTLIRILAGEERADEGALTVAGTRWSVSQAAAAVAVVHQEPALFPNLTVAENMMVGRERSRFFKPRISQADGDLMKALAIGDIARRPLETCTLAMQQRTEIARALALEARVFLFDEPNSALTDDESDELFREIHALAADGRIVIFVSHRLGDLVAHCGRVAVIRDGRVAVVLEGEALTEEAIAQELVIGGQEREVDAHASELATRSSAAEEVFSVRGWTHRDGEFANIDLRVDRGEIVALMGVEGSGGRELLRSFGGLERSTGEIELDGMRGRDALTATAYVPATRQHSLYGNYSVGDNLIVRLGVPEIAGRALMLRKGRIRALAQHAVTQFLVKTRSLSQGIRALSGGNQQKVAIAQALAKRPTLLLLEEPTRGVDVGSRREIYRLLQGFAAAGNAVIMFCTEVPEIFEAADRAYVMSDGRLSRSLEVGEFDQVEALATEVSKLERHHRIVAD